VATRRLHAEGGCPAFFCSFTAIDKQGKQKLPDKNIFESLSNFGSLAALVAIESVLKKHLTVEKKMSSLIETASVERKTAQLTGIRKRESRSFVPVENLFLFTGCTK
jgi:hypothetical protein